MESIQTAYGEVPLAEVIKQYERVKANNIKTNSKRKEHNQTEQGKLKNRERAKLYYEKNKEKVLEKRAVAYEPKRKRHPNKKREQSSE